MKSNKQRVEAAKARQEVYDKLTPHQRLAKLDQVFGKDNGAAKQRAKLLKKATT